MPRGMIIGIFFSLVMAGSAYTATIYVPDDYTAIQAAINVAADGDTIIVRAGTYVENIDFIGKAITVESELGAIVTTIDGNQVWSVVTFKNGEGAGSVIDGFTLTNGSGTSVSGFTYGGGIYCDSASPTITNNIITENTVNGYSRGHGGGICCVGSSSPMITNNAITGNSVYGIFGSSGGGICCIDSSSPTIMKNNIIGNTSVGGGGGIHSSGSYSSAITNNTIMENTCISGGGIHCYDSLTITGNIIAGNSVSSEGGGIYCYGGYPTITNNAIISNTASKDGGAVYCTWFSYPTITNNTFTGNYVSGSGGGIYCHASFPTITNTILWDNTSSTGTEIYIGSSFDPSILTIDCSDIEGGQSSVYVDPGCSLNWGPGMIDADPLFADMSYDDCHLTWQSPCRDTGANVAVTKPTDFEGDPRIALGTVDIGADEFHTHLYQVGDVIPGSSIEVKVVGDPGMTPVRLALGYGVHDPPQSTPYGDLYLVLPPAKTFNLGSIPGDGVLVYIGTVPPSWQTGEEYFFQALVGPKAPRSVLTNLMVLTVE